MVLCQARVDTDGDGQIGFGYLQHGELVGDRPRLYLVIGGGAGTPIDAIPAVSADGRWLALVRRNRLELVDSRTGEAFALSGADAKGDARPGAPHRAARFAGNKLLYVRARTSGDALVVHDPETHVEREFAVPDRLWRIHPDTGRYLRLYTIPRGDDWPRLNSNLSSGECRRALSYSTFGQSGPSPTMRRFDLERGLEPTIEGKLVAIIGETLVRATPDGALYFDSDQIAPPGCDPVVAALMAAPERVLATCRGSSGVRELLLGRNLRVDLGPGDEDVRYTDSDDEPLTLSSTAPNPEIVCGKYCVDAATNRAIGLDGGWPCAKWKRKMYICKHDYDYNALKQKSLRAEILDVATGKRTALTTVGQQHQVGRFVLDLEGQLIDLEQEKVIGKAPGALSINRTGRVLRPHDGCADCGYVRRGPFRWGAP